MLARKCKVIRMQKGISMDELAKEIHYTRDKIQTYENLRSKNIDDEMVNKISKYFNTTIEDIEKVYEVELIKEGHKVPLTKIVRTNVTNEEIKDYINFNKERQKEINRRTYHRKKEMDKGKPKKERKKKYNKTYIPLRTHNPVVKKVDIPKDTGKPFKCLNQACPLNKECVCDNPVVRRGDAPCYGKNLVKNKPKNKVWEGNQSLFMANNVDLHERGLK